MTYPCHQCNKVYNHASSLSKHKKTCVPPPPVATKPVNETNEDNLQKQIDKLKKELDELKQAQIVGTGATGTHGASGSTTNITNNNNITNIVINLNNFGNEDLSHITPQLLEFCLLNPKRGITSLIENIHYDENMLCNNNIRHKSSKRQVLEKWVDSTWIECDESNTIDELIRKGYRLLNIHHADNYGSDPNIQDDDMLRKKYEYFRFLSDKQHIDYYAVKRDMRLLIKNKSPYIAVPQTDV